MKQFNSFQAWRHYRRALDGRSLGFVPTMGALHAGHQALVDASIVANEVTVVSIFINPTQFDQATDLAAYPNSLDEDLALLEQRGVDAVLLPDSAQLYPDAYHYRVTESELSRRFCGAHRPGHFDGVLSVVMKLFNIVRPDRAYFGEKDFQQLALVRGMCAAFFMNVDIVAIPTVRDPGGLALSSRNQRLTPAQRQTAASLNRILRASENAGQAAEKLAQAGFTVDYVEDFSRRRLAAVSLGDVRLIDNTSLE